jgi:hypothetical protein
VPVELIGDLWIGVSGDLLTTYPELLVWKAFTSGALVDLRSGDPAVDDPARGGDWDGGRIVRAEVIRAILLGFSEPEPGAVAALRIAGARITGCLDLMHAEVCFPVHLASCWFETSPDLCWAMTRYLDFGVRTFPGCWQMTFESIASGAHRLPDRPAAASCCSGQP